MALDLQKASMWKRASAFLFDFIILGILVVGLAAGMSAITGYDKYMNQVDEAYATYEEQYGIDFEISQDEFNELTKEEQDNWWAAYEELCADEAAMHAYNMVVNLTMLIATLSFLISFVILEFAIPMLFKNGQTLGKKIFGIGVMRVDYVKVSGPLMFIRTVLGKFTIETMIPIFIIMMIFFGSLGIEGTIILGLILLVQIILMITTQTNSMIHDTLAKTVVVDIASQMIFDSEANMIAYKEKIHAEQVARQAY
ncbi:MAG: RDD family protein [Agathobacter sp.]